MWNILIAEDNSSDAQLLVDGLNTIAHCTVAKDGPEALEIYKDSIEKNIRFDFILLDVQLPGKSGFDILKNIRILEESYISESSQESKIIMLTTYKDSLMEHYNMGWDDFISKPINTSILKNRLKELANQKNKLS